MDRAALAERGIERLAALGDDLTEKVITAYYQRFPEAETSFERHGLGDQAELESRMVTTTAFLLLQWAQDPFSTRIEQGTTIVQHHDTLEIGPQWYLGLIDAVLEVLHGMIPDEAATEHSIWHSVRDEIAAFIESVRPEFWRPDEDGPLPHDPSKSQKAG